MNKAQVAKLIRNEMRFAELCEACRKPFSSDDLFSEWRTDRHVCHDCAGAAWFKANKKPEGKKS